MLSWRSHVLFISLLLLVLTHVGTCLKCFQCGETKGGDGICRDEQGNKHATKDCPPRQVCVTHWTHPLSIGQLETPELVARFCSDRDYCNNGAKMVESRLGVTTKQCRVCTTDYCNSGSTVVPSFVAIALLAIRYIFS